MSKSIFLLLFCCLLPAGCGRVLPKTDVPCINPEIVFTEEDRSDLRGTVMDLEIIARGSHYYGWIYLPEEYNPDNEKQQLPVLYFLSGMRYADTAFQNYDRAGILDDFLSSEERGPFIYAALPCLDFSTDFEDVFIHHILPLTQENFHASSRRNKNGLAGISSGGDLAFRMFFKYPGRFSVLGQHSAAFTKDDLKKWDMNLKSRRGLKKDSFRFDVGEQDPLIDVYTLLRPILDTDGAVYEYYTSPGSHSAFYWQEHFPEYINWYSRRLNRSARLIE